jgi:type I restriction enzyme M protein
LARHDLIRGKATIGSVDLPTNAEIQSVPGLVKVVSWKEITEADWSLTPGRYVGVASAEVDEDFDFEQAITEIHSELAELNQEAIGLAKTIQANFEESGI